MDAFFAQIEERDKPWLKGKPVIIGGPPNSRGVASTCNYEARKYGVHSGMSLTECYRKCPDGIFLRTHGGKYSSVSVEVMTALFEFTDKVHAASVDEAYMDMTDCRAVFHGLPEMGKAVKQAVWDKVKLTCSAGIAPNKYVAKMCSGENKPDGLTIMNVEEFRRRFAPRKLSALVGIGESTEKALNSMGIWNIGQLQQYPEKALKDRFGVNGPRLRDLANGEHTGEVTPMGLESEEKTMGHESTFRQDTDDVEYIKAVLLKLSEDAARRLRRGGFKGRRVTLKLRYADFSTLTHQRSMNYLTNEEGDIYREACKCLEEALIPHRKVRLVGVRVSHLQKTGDSYSVFQGDFFKSGSEAKKLQALKAVDSLRDRFGEKVMRYAGDQIVSVK